MTAPTNGHAPAPVPAPPATPFDTGNPFLSEGPAQLSVTPVPTPLGQRLALTIRTTSTTLTVLLAKDDAGQWADLIQRETARMNGLILPPG